MAKIQILQDKDGNLIIPVSSADAIIVQIDEVTSMPLKSYIKRHQVETKTLNILEPLPEPTTSTRVSQFKDNQGNDCYPLSHEKAIVGYDQNGELTTLEKKLQYIYNALDGARYPTKLIGPITDVSNVNLIQEINDEVIGGPDSQFQDLQVGHAYYYSRSVSATLNSHNIPTGSGLIESGDMIVCLKKEDAEDVSATGFHTEWLIVNGNVTEQQIRAIITNYTQGITTAFEYWVEYVLPELEGYQESLEDYNRWLRQPAITAAKAANDAIHELEDCSGKWIELTQAEYNERKANTNMENIPWTPIDESKEYLHENAKYILSDATYESELSRVINEMFIPVTKAEYDELKDNGQLNPMAYYFISYPEVEPNNEE